MINLQTFIITITVEAAQVFLPYTDGNDESLQINHVVTNET